MAVDVNKISRILNEKGVSQKCPRCGHDGFGILDSYVAHSLQSDLYSFSLGGRNIPTVVTACNNCGYLCQHAAGALGLLQKRENS